MSNKKNLLPPPAGLAALFETPYYAVMFTNQRRSGDAGYGDMADRMVELAADQEGYLGAESTRDTQGLGITLSYWRSEADIAAWRRHAEHQLAREQGRADWYEYYAVRVAKVERSYGWTRSDGPADPQAPAQPSDAGGQA